MKKKMFTYVLRSIQNFVPNVLTHVRIQRLDDLVESVLVEHARVQIHQNLALWTGIGDVRGNERI